MTEPLGSVAFVVNDLGLSGGVNVLLKHAAALAQEPDCRVEILVHREDVPAWSYPELGALNVRPVRDGAAEEYDLLIFTWWETLRWAPALSSKRALWFMQSAEDRFYDAANAEKRAQAQALLLAPLPRVAVATWIRELVEQAAPACRCPVVLNGIDKDTFRPEPACIDDNASPLRVLIEGNEGFFAKGIDETIAAVAKARADIDVTWVRPNIRRLPEAPPGVDRVIGPLTHHEMAEAMRESHVMIKLSRVEGMAGPPLEAFHCGSTVITTDVTGRDEYVVHGRNGIVVPFDDVDGVANAVSMLAGNRDVLSRLRAGSRATAEAWPSWPESSAAFIEAVRGICSMPSDTYSFAALQLFVRGVWSVAGAWAIGVAENDYLRNELRHSEHLARHWEHQFRVLEQETASSVSSGVVARASRLVRSRATRSNGRGEGQGE